MNTLYTIWSVARFETKLLLRSWAFRIFSALGVFVLVMMDIGLGLKTGWSPHFLNSLSGSLPLFNIKILNIYQGIIAAFLATEFIKRDRKHDTTQVMFVRSFSNTSYLLGKLCGILAVFTILNVVVLAVAVPFHIFGPTPFALTPYFVYSFWISLPTLIFMVGMSVMLVTLIRNQAVVFVIMLGYSLLVLIFLGQHLFHVFDSFAFYQPLVMSDFTGLANPEDVYRLRGAYFLWGLGLIAVAALLTPRLRQSRIANIVTAFVGVVCLCSATVLGYDYLQGKFADREYRHQLRNTAQAMTEIPVPTVTQYRLLLDHQGEKLDMGAELTVVNNSPVVLDSLLFTLNPGLITEKISANREELSFTRTDQLLWIRPNTALSPGDSLSLSLDYAGRIDDRYCYLDIDDKRYESLYRIWLYSFPKQYSLVTPDFVHLTAEAGWYPIPGLPPGAAFPAPIKRNFADYQLSVDVPPGMIAVSQGRSTIDHATGSAVYTFNSEQPLAQMSLTIGRYEQRQIEVDSVSYRLCLFPGHDYFADFLDEVGDTLPSMIRELKNDYEVGLGLQYPHARFALVELPIQLYSYQRLWTVAQETVQPEIVFMPEMGTILAGGDFRRMKRRANRRQERANQEGNPAEIQAEYFSTFAKVDILGMENSRRGIRRFAGVETRYEVLPNLVSYMTNVSSVQCPVLNYAFEAYFQDRVSPPGNTRSRRWRGMTDEEKANLALQKKSLAGIITDPNAVAIARPTLQAKGRHLLSLLEAKIGRELFSGAIADFLIANHYRNISDRDFGDFVAAFDSTDFSAVVDTWYRDTALAGFLIKDVESYKVQDGERTRTQLKFTLTNPTGVDGVVELGLRYRRNRMGGFSRGFFRQTSNDYTELLWIPAHSAMDFGVVLDDDPSEMTIDTYVSRNIPSIITVQFREQTIRRNERPYVSREIIADRDDQLVAGEYLVDNEDQAFDVGMKAKENWLRRTLLGWFGSADSTDPYVGMRFWNPPGNWVATTGPEFYGKFIHSGMFKEAGDGRSIVAWNVKLEEPGEYDIYYYESGIQMPRWGRHRGGGQYSKGEKTFLVHHEDGIEEITVDLDGVEEGWNYLGTFRLAAGENTVEMTDANTESFVIADAIKWVRR